MIKVSMDMSNPSNLLHGMARVFSWNKYFGARRGTEMFDITFEASSFGQEDRLKIHLETSYIIPNLRKMKTTIDYNERLGHLSGEITHLQVNVKVIFLMFH